MNGRTRIIAARFGAASESYDAAARVQAIAADRLFARLRDALPSAPRRILEFGCGTGLLTAHLRHLWPDATIISSDLAFAMADCCRKRHGGTAMVMDAERPSFAEGAFDLVCGSLAAQWFARPEPSIRGLQRLAAPGGVIGLTTLGPATLREWGKARAAAGLVPGGLDYLTLAQVAAIRCDDVQMLSAEGELVRDPISDALGFLAGLRAIGADIGNSDTAKSPAALRRALRALDASADAVTYEVLTVIWQRAAVEND